MSHVLSFPPSLVFPSCLSQTGSFETSGPTQPGHCCQVDRTLPCVHNTGWGLAWLEMYTTSTTISYLIQHGGLKILVARDRKVRWLWAWEPVGGDNATKMSHLGSLVYAIKTASINDQWHRFKALELHCIRGTWNSCCLIMARGEKRNLLRIIGIILRLFIMQHLP